MKTQAKPPMPFAKALRLLPSYVSHLAKRVTDLAELTNRVEGQLKLLAIELFVEFQQTHSGNHATAKALELDRKIEQLKNFMEQTQ